MRSGIEFFLYHYPCPDGAFAAFAAMAARGPPAAARQFIPHKTNAPLPSSAVISRCKSDSSSGDSSVVANSRVYLLDFCGSGTFMHELCLAGFERVVLIDHHKTAIEAVEAAQLRQHKNFELHFDLQKSGATLALDYFNPPSLGPETRECFRFVEDNDLFVHRIEHAREFYSGLRDMELEWDFNVNVKLFETLSSLRAAKLIESGKEVIRREDALIHADIENKFVVEIGGKRFYGVMTANKLLRSEIGNRMAVLSKEKFGVSIAAVGYAGDQPGQVLVSIRSTGNEPEVDATKITALFGGGGHFNAAGMTVTQEQWDSFRRD